MWDASWPCHVSVDSNFKSVGYARIDPVASGSDHIQNDTLTLGARAFRFDLQMRMSQGSTMPYLMRAGLFGNTGGIYFSCTGMSNMWLVSYWPTGAGGTGPTAVSMGIYAVNQTGFDRFTVEKGVRPTSTSTWRASA
jgi:hypothetical protein